MPVYRPNPEPRKRLIADLKKAHSIKNVKEAVLKYVAAKWVDSLLIR